MTSGRVRACEQDCVWLVQADHHPFFGLIQGLRDLGFNIATPEAQSAIIAILLPDQEKTVRMWQALLEQGVYVNMARPPATPAGMYLLRCSLCADHTAEQVTLILERFARAGRATGTIA